MNLKYKLILVFTTVILASSLPLTLFVLDRQESDKITMLTHQGETFCKIIAHSVLNIMLQNGGDITASRVDAKDMMRMLSPLAASGLARADAIIESPNPAYNGIVLSSYTVDRSSLQARDPAERMSGAELNALKALPPVSEVRLPGVRDPFIQFIAHDQLPGGGLRCAGRLLYAQSIVLEPIRRLRLIIYAATAAAIMLVGLLGIAISRYISRPLSELALGVEKMSAGDLDHHVRIRSRDEIGRLATTFNHLARMVKLEIDALESANRELRRLDNVKDEFMANMSHELRTPLYGIMGLADSLSQGVAGPMNDEARHLLSLIATSGRRLSHLVNDILDFSRLKHQDIDLQVSRVNLNSAVQLVISLLRYMIEQKSLEVHNEIPPEGVFVYADEDRLQQILLNILGNAVKFTETGGATVSCRQGEHGADMLTVIVTDTGIGIPADRMEHIFESFEQADSSITRRYGGSGLGLTISKKLVELHGGRIWAESRPGGGSSFSFTLPLTPEGLEEHMAPSDTALEDDIGVSALIAAGEPEKAAPTSMLKNDGTHGERILVVDDEPVNLQVLAGQLSLEGYTVDTAADGITALDRIHHAGPYDIVLLDVMLPRMSGYEVCRSIREDHSLHELPVIMLTARNKPGDVLAGFEAGANDYITKPVDRTVLLARVHSLISLKSSVMAFNELSLIKHDLNLAHSIQQSILLHEIPSVPGVSIAVRYIPMKELGGDYYDIRARDNGLSALIADVSGHGVGAAFISAMLKVVYAFHLAYVETPGRLLEHLNRSMTDLIGDQYLTACIAHIDLKAMRLRTANAGHWPLLLVRGKNDRIIAEATRDVPVGWLADTRYSAQDFPIMKGDRIIMYTDGFVEERNPERGMFGFERLLDVVREGRGMTAEECAGLMAARLKEWSGASGDEWLQDDLTLIIIDIGETDR